MAGAERAASGSSVNARAERLILQGKSEHVLLETVLQQMPSGVVVAEAPSGRVVLANDQMKEIWRYPFSGPDEILAYRASRLFHPDGRPYKDGEWPIDRAVRGETVKDEEIRLRRGDDTFGLIRVNSIPVMDHKGHIIAAVSLVDDVTEQRRMEQEIESLAKFPSENPHPVLRVGKDGTVSYGNAAGIALLSEWKCSVGELAPEHWRQLVLEVLHFGATRQVDEEYEDKTFSFDIVPVVDSGYVNIYGRDITERKKAEDAIGESAETARQRAEELEKLMDVDPMALWVSRDPQCSVIIGNAAANRFYEAGAGENVSAGPASGGEQDLTRRFFQNGRELKPEELPMQEAATKGVEIRDSEIDVLLPSGRTITILGNASPLLDTNGMVRGCVASFIDITERKRAEAALAEERNIFKGVMENSGVQIAYLDPEFNFISVNSAYAKGSGHTVEELIGKNHFTLFPSEENRAIFKRVRDTGEAVEYRDRPFEFLDQPSRGVTYWDWTLTPIKDQSFRVQGLVLALKETTERKRLEETIIQSERKYRALYETMIDGIVAVDMDGRIVECNQAYADMLGYSKDELRNLTYQELTPQKWHGIDAAIVREQVVERGFSDVHEKEYTRKDGSVFPVSLRSWLIRDEKGEPSGIWAIVQDISRRKRMEDELRAHTQQLERLVEERTRQLRDAERLATIGQTATMVGHDIRNPLQAIRGALYLAKEELEPIVPCKEKDAVKEMLDEIDEETVYINKIVSDLQDYAGSLNPKLEDVDVQNIIDEALSVVQLPESVRVLVTVEEDVQRFTADKGMMRRILTNLISNALDAMTKGGELAIAAHKKGEVQYLSVQDTGTGIPEEIKPKMFQPLFTTKAQGQGLGLAVCKRLVEAQGGQITFDSETGKGTTFTVALPSRRE